MVAMLVSTMVIVVGLGVSSIILRQFNLAVLSRESQMAFYAADTLIECLMYWDLKGLVFDAYETDGPIALTGLICDDTDTTNSPTGDVLINIIPIEPTGGVEICTAENLSGSVVPKYARTFEASMIFESVVGASGPPAQATITKRESCLAKDDFTINTTIDVNGYNKAAGTRKIERGLSLTY